MKSIKRTVKIFSYKKLRMLRRLAVFAVFLLGLMTVLATTNNENDTEPPRVQSTVPPDTATDVPVDTLVLVYFNEAMDTSSVNTSTFLLSCDGSSIVGQVEAAGTRGAFIPNQQLDPGAFCTATVTRGIYDVSGNALPSVYSWSFITAGIGAAPAVIGTTPANGATNVAVTSQLTATFSEAMNPATLDDTSFYLHCGVPRISGTVSYSNFVATFVPDSTLPYGMGCTATVTTEAQDLVGDGLGSDYTWSFTTVPSPAVRSWSTPQRIESHSGDGKYPQLSMDSQGNVWVIWDEDDGGTHNVWVNQYEVGAGWSGAEEIMSNVGPIQYPHIALNDNGNAVAVGSYNVSVPYKVWAKRYVDGVGWDAGYTLLGPDGIDAYIQNPKVALDADDNAIAVWQLTAGTPVSYNNIAAARYESGTGWGGWEYIELENAGDATLPQIRVDSLGNALVVWQQFNGTTTNINANYYLVGTGWEGVHEIDDTNESCTVPQLGLDASDNALVVWRQTSAIGADIYSNAYLSTTGWGTAVTAESIAFGIADIPQVAVAPDGTAVVVWKHAFAPTSQAIMGNYYAPLSGWGGGDTVDSDTPTPQNPSVAMGVSGEAMALWNRSNIFAGRFVVGLGWDAPQIIDSLVTPSYALAPKIIVDSQGRAIAVWYQYDSATATFDIWANRYE